MFDWLFEPVDYASLYVILIAMGIVRGLFELMDK